MPIVKLTRRAVLSATGGLVVGGSLVGCGEETVGLLDDLLPIHPLDESGDVEMSEGPSESSPYSDPIILYATTTLTPGSASAPNTDALANPDGLDMELLEVRITLTAQPDGTNLESFADEVAGLGIGLKMDMGTIAIVDADTPVSLFGSARDADDTRANFVYTNTANPNQNQIATPATYSWRLKYPLLIPGGAVAIPVFTHLGQIISAVTIDVMYFCRQRPAGQRRPDKVKVPWCGSYNSVSFDVLNGQPGATDFSSESDLYNPFDVPLEIAKLGGSCVIGGGNGELLEWYGAHRFSLTTLRIRSRRGNELVRVKTAFDSLFPVGWRVWDIPGGWHMTPGEFYKVQLTVAPVTYDTTQSPGPVQFAISQVGYRDVPIADFLAGAFSESAS